MFGLVDLNLFPEPVHRAFLERGESPAQPTVDAHSSPRGSSVGSPRPRAGGSEVQWKAQELGSPKFQLQLLYFLAV